MDDNNIENFTTLIKATELLLQINNTDNQLNDSDKCLNITSEYIENKLDIPKYFETLEFKNTSDFGISIYYYTKNWEEDNLLPVAIEDSYVKKDKLLGEIFEIKYVISENPSESSHLSLRIHNTSFLNNKISKIILRIKQFPETFNKLRSKFESIAGPINSIAAIPKLEEINELREKIGQLSKEHKLQVRSADSKKYIIENIPKSITVPDLTLTLRDFQNSQNIKAGTAISKFDPITSVLTVAPNCGIHSGKISFDRFSNTYTLTIELDKKCDGVVESKIIGHNFQIELLPQRTIKSYSLEIEPELTTTVRKLIHNLDINFISSDYKMRFEGEYYRIKKDKTQVREVCKFTTQGETFKSENLIRAKIENGIDFEEMKLCIENSNEINFDLSTFETQFIKLMLVTMTININEVFFNIKLYDEASYLKYKESKNKG